jgi:hypothetical protein
MRNDIEKNPATRIPGVKYPKFALGASPEPDRLWEIVAQLRAEIDIKHTDVDTYKGHTSR